MHTFPVFFQDTFIAINLINNPRNDNCYITPCRRTVGIQNIRHYMRNTLFKRRFCYHITHPFRVEQCCISVKCRCPGEYLRISGPSKTLVSLRTICRDIKEIISLAPCNITLQLIYFFVRTMEITGLFHIRMCHTGNKLICCKFFHSFHTDITESVECKMRSENLFFSVADKCVD